MEKKLESCFSSNDRRNDKEAQMVSAAGADDKKGGWKTLPSLTGSALALNLASTGALSNLIVFLIQQFNVKAVDAVQVANVIFGCNNMAPIIGAIFADSYLGCFQVITISCLVTFVGFLQLTMIGSLSMLRPPPCPPPATSCAPPSSSQYAILYMAITLIILGSGGIRFTIVTLGSGQYDDPKQRETFINWFFLATYTGTFIAMTAVTYIASNTSWAWGFGVCLAASIANFIVFILGKSIYRDVKPKGSPFTGLARVVVAAIRKRGIMLSSKADDYYGTIDTQTSQMTSNEPTPVLTSKFRCLNKAAVIAEGDISLDGSLAKPWRLCSIQQVEDLKTIIRLFPLWSSSILLGVPIGVQMNIIILQALAMDRSLTSNFTVPAASFIVFSVLAVVICLALIDRVVYPIILKLTGWSPAFLHRIGMGHILNILSMVVTAMIESRRLLLWHENGQPAVVPMSALWLGPPLMLAGAGEACLFPGQVSLYYQEFPSTLKSMATAIITMLIAIAFYLSAAFMGVVKSTTDWLPDNINEGHLDYLYWVLALLGLVNFFYFVLCAKVYGKNV